MARPSRGEREDPPAPTPGARRRPRWRSLAAFPALILALLGIAGLVPTIRSAPPPPPERDPIRYLPGEGDAGRLVIILTPQLNERDLALLKGALLPGAGEGGTIFAVERPSFMSFEDSSLVLLAGNGPSAATPPAPANQPPDTLVRSVLGQGRHAALIGPAEWRALFGLGGPAPGSPSPAPRADVLLHDTSAALASRDAALVVALLRDLTGRDLRDQPELLRGALAAVAGLLGPRDALLLVGGGALGEPLTVALSGAGTNAARLRSVPLNDVAPTCAVLLGAPYPAEARGRIAWALLATNDRRKAEATAALARQRTWLAITAVRFGVPYPETLRLLTGQIADADAEIAIGHYDYGYQLSASILDQADRQIVALAGVTPLPLPPPRRAAWGLVAPCLAVAALALAVTAVAGAWGTLAASLAGGGAALAIWLGFVIVLQRMIVPNLATVVALTAIYALCGGLLAAWLGRRWSRPRPALAIDLLVLLAALPAAACAYRYGLPWRLRLEEATPLFLWRSALLAPVGLLLAGYGAARLFARGPGR